tara:strand:- start:245 stop:418 length:174 start_codon:yes stop_codon:yes gene_type:complete
MNMVKIGDRLTHKKTNINYTVIEIIHSWKTQYQLSTNDFHVIQIDDGDLENYIKVKQ